MNSTHHEPFTAPAIPLPAFPAEPDFTRADLEFYGVDHSGPSYEARIFLNNVEATTASELNSESGYAGSFHIFGHGGCFGQEGHCDVSASYRDEFDARLPHALTPQKKVVIVTEALKRLMTTGAHDVTVTIVPVIEGTSLPLGQGLESWRPMIDSISLRTYD